jgi:hypothetical protein
MALRRSGVRLPHSPLKVVPSCHITPVIVLLRNRRVTTATLYNIHNNRILFVYIFGINAVDLLVYLYHYLFLFPFIHIHKDRHSYYIRCKFDMYPPSYFHFPIGFHNYIDNIHNIYCKLGMGLVG